MANFAAKYLVSNATAGVRHTMGDVGKQFSQEEPITKEDIERAEQRLSKEAQTRKRKQAQMENSRAKERGRIRAKYGIEKSKRHEPTDTHSAMLIRNSSKSNESELLIQEGDEEDDDCCPCCNLRTCFPCLKRFFNAKHS